MTHQCIILADAPGALVELCGISMVERLLRTLQRCGLRSAIVLSSTPDSIAQELAKPSWARAELEVKLQSRSPGAVGTESIVDVCPENTGLLLIIPANSVFDERLVQLLILQPLPAALVDSNVSPPSERLVDSVVPTKYGKLCGPAVIKRDWARARTGPLEKVLRTGLEDQMLTPLDVAAQPSYSAALRRTQDLYWFPAPSPDHVKSARRILLGSIQKGSLDLPAIIHGPVETMIVSKLCRRSITPNQLTILTNVVAWIGTIFFATGRLGWGLVLALSVGILDGLDGKLARLKVETTKRGRLEHWFDALFEISWWTALAYYFRVSGQLTSAFWYLLLLLGAEAIDLAAKGGILFVFGRLIDELSWFDRAVRLFGGRRNIYVWILSIGFLLGNPAKAFAVMAWWEVATAAVHIIRATFAISLKQNQRAMA